MQRTIEIGHRGLIGTQPSPSSEIVETQGTRVRREGGFPVGWLIAPGVAWLILFLVVPLASIIVFSFWTSTGHGMTPDPTVQYYHEYFVNEGFFDPEERTFLQPGIFIKTLWSTFRFTLTVMFFCLLLGVPDRLFPRHAHPLVQVADGVVPGVHGAVLDELPHPRRRVAADARAPRPAEQLLHADGGHREAVHGAAVF